MKVKILIIAILSIFVAAGVASSATSAGNGCETMSKKGTASCQCGDANCACASGDSSKCSCATDCKCGDANCACASGDSSKCKCSQAKCDCSGNVDGKCSCDADCTCGHCMTDGKAGPV